MKWNLRLGPRLACRDDHWRVYGLKAVLDGHAGEDLVLLSQVRQRARPRSHQDR